VKLRPSTHITSNQPICLELVPTASIKSNPYNAREHDRRQLGKLKRSIEKFGFNVPVIIDNSNELLCGHARVEAAKELGLPTIPVIRTRHLSESQKRAFMIADNRIAELSVWDKKRLRKELQFLSNLDIDYDFSAIGFDTAQVDFLLDGDDEADDRADILPPVLEMPAVSKLGDLWRMGENHVYCGNALERFSYETLLAGDRAQMVFTDPPYNVRIDGHVGGLGTVKHREFVMASGEMTNDQFRDFLATFLEQTKDSVCDGAIGFVCMDWRHTGELLAAARTLELKNICVWVKNNGGMGSLYRSQHEFVFVYKFGAANHINNVELGKHGRNRTTVWEYRGVNSFGADREESLRAHPTVKPVALVADAIKDCSTRGDLILDPFGGSGTTVIAAEKTKRRAALIEIDPLYVDVIIRRWQLYTGATAILAATGEPFSNRERSFISPCPTRRAGT
jgi:DNA modification methylase